ncbi:MAG: hypothetical protein JNL11_20225 [Bdellovibrionaceae bacterium]|nr:hypothetical protein [Pseudobdellovibrionaceae bacterium]
MVVQKLKLHEWFLVYQLDQIKKTMHHIPIYLKLDISAYVNEYKGLNTKIPTTALLIKIIGTWAAANPTVNKMLFRTFFGLRFLKGDEIRINFPLGIQWQGQTAVTAIVIRNPQLKTIEQIHDEIKIAKSKPLSAYPITYWAYSHVNHFLNRFLLGAIHTVISNFPSIYWRKGGGCISISSLSNFFVKDHLFSACSFGPTGFTFFYKDIEVVDGKTYLNLSIAADHNTFAGYEIVELVNRLLVLPKIAKANRSQNITQDLHV